jgi:hypothetical protein
MPDYVFTNRDGEVYDISSDDELTETQIKDIDIDLNPARKSDYFLGSASTLSRFGYNVLESAHEVGQFIGGEVSNAMYGDRGKDVPNPWDDFKESSTEMYEGDIPQHVKDRLSYRAVGAATQLVAAVGSSVLSPLTLAAQGFAGGRDDYLQTMGIDPNTATQEELEMSRAVGATIAAPVFLLDKVGLGAIAKGMTRKLTTTITPGVVKAATSGMSKKAAEQEASKLLRQAATEASKGLKQVVAPATKRVLGMATVESGTEYTQEVTQNVIMKDVIGADPDRPRTQGATEAGVLGFMVGGVPGGVQRAVPITVEGAKGLVRVAEIGWDTGNALAKSQAAKKIVDMTANGLVRTTDMTTELGHKMARVLVDKGINIEPLVKGGDFLMEGAKTAAKKTVSIAKDIPAAAHKGAVAWTKSPAGKQVDKVIRPLSDMIGSVNPRMGQEVESFEREKMKRSDTFSKMIEESTDAMGRMDKKAYQELKGALLAEDFDSAKRIVVEEGGQAAWDNIGTTLGLVYSESAIRGSGVGHVEKYYPSFVTNYEGLSKALGHKLPNSHWEKALTVAEKGKGSPLTTEESAALFEDLIRSKKPQGVEIGSPSPTKKRVLDPETRRKHAKFYADPIDAMNLYLNQMSENITRMDWAGAMYDVQMATTVDEIYTEEEVKYAEQNFTPVEGQVAPTAETQAPKPTLESTPLYHGGSKGFTTASEVTPPNNKYTKGFFLSTSKGVAAVNAMPASKFYANAPDVGYSKIGKRLTEFRADLKNPYIVDAQESSYAGITTPKEMKGWTDEAEVDTDNIADWALENGYDGVIIKNVIEGKGAGEISDTYVVFDNQNIKTKAELEAAPKPTTGQAIYKPEMRPIDRGAKPQKVRKLGAFGRAIQEEIEAGRLTDQQLDELHDLMGVRFQRNTPMSGFLRGLKGLTHIAFLGSPTTAIRQLGDYTYTTHANGMIEALKAAGHTTTTLEDVFQQRNTVNTDFTDPGNVAAFLNSSWPNKIQAALDVTVTATGMRAMDSKAKAVYLTATRNRWRKILNGKDSSTKTKLIQDIQLRQGIENGKQSLDDIRADRLTDSVRELLLHELIKIAPMTQSDMPYYYNKYPNLRILYALKSYTIKQFNYTRNEAIAKIMSGDRAEIKEGFTNLISLSASLAVANIPADILQSFIMGENLDMDLDDMLIDNLWRLLGLNSYSQVVIEREGIGTALENLTTKLPLMKVVDAVGHDIFHFAPPFVSEDSKTQQFIPVFGKITKSWQDKAR